MKKFIAPAITIVAGFLLIACGSVSPSNDNVNGSSESFPAKVDGIRDGDWEIGSKDNLPLGIISSGTYIISSPKDGSGCYWETAKDFDHKLASIITNDNVSPGSTMRVTVKSSYKVLTLKGDCLAKKKV